ncbi:hypothetical protein N431DRAFT_343477, partial [Stipitochalara longipes BDJ]
INYILVLVNTSRYINILYYILILELYKITHNFNISALIKSIINKILGINLLLVLYINLKSLYKYLIKLGII